MQNFEKWLAIAWLPENDGQPYHVTPGDEGGATAWGVTFTTWKAWQALRRQPATLALFASANANDFSPLLRSWFWNAVHGDVLPTGVDLMTAEAALMSGPGVAVKTLQRAINVPVDGHIGPITLARATLDPAATVTALKREYLAFVASLASAPEFGGGWTRRIEADAEKALTWIRPAVSPPPAVSSLETDADTAVSSLETDADTAALNAAEAAISPNNPS